MRSIGLLVGVVCISSSVFAQASKHFRVEQGKNYNTVTLKYTTSSGVCYLGQGESRDPVSVYSVRDIDDFNHSFDKKEKNGQLEVNISLHEKNNETFSQSISNKMFAEARPEDNIWKVLLTDDIAYNLDLAYGIGTAYLDLAGLSIKNLYVKTGSADVNIDYLSSMPNAVTMDTMAIKVDLGNVTVRRINHANVQNILAEVGFGNMLLDLSEPLDEPCRVRASVGAGSLEIMIPKDKIPILIRVKESMLCDVRLTRSFHELTDNVYTNMEVDDDSDNMLEFDVDVSFGSIIFKEKK
jgi:hypothetical protein